MLYLLTAICASVLVSFFLRLGKQHVTSNMVMFLSNYTVCSLVASFYMGKTIFTAGPGLPFALGLGAVGGVLFLLSFVLLQMNIRKNGVVMASLFMKLGVLVPTVMAVAVFRETPGGLQILGFLLALLAIALMQLEKGEKGGRFDFWLLILLLCGGFTDSLVNIYDQVGMPQWKNQFLFFIFLFAGLLCLVIALIQKKPFSWKDLFWGAIVGVPNYYSSRFLLLSLQSVKAVAAYPIYNVGAMALITLLGVVCFREKLSRRKQLGVAVILLSLVLLNLS